jgi:imidazole glycerol-phosphate synthase subunit HisF
VLTNRLIVCLDVKGGRVVKGTQFVNLRDVGDPVELAARYEAEGADEVTFLDISASEEERATLLDVARRTAERLFVPLTIGGGVRTADDVGRALRAGADKVSINSAAVQRPEVLTDAAWRFGAQCVVASIDARRRAGSREGSDAWEVYTHGGKRPTGLDAVEWARECVRRGAGEILLTSIDRDGARIGYDVPLTRAVADAVEVPVIASGGAGEAAHCRDAIALAHADAALVAGILHDGLTTVREIKQVMRAGGVRVREA